MKTLKKLLCVTLLLVLFNNNLFADSRKCIDSCKVSGLLYSLYDDHTAQVEPDNFSYSGDITIPSKIVYKEVEYRVSSVADRAFADCGNLTKVVFPEEMDRLGSDLFLYAIYLDEVQLPKKVKSWAASSEFYQCDYLKKIILPSGLKKIGTDMFTNCESLEELVIPEGVESIESFVVAGTKSLKTVKLPSTVTSIETDAFNQRLANMNFDKSDWYYTQYGLEYSYSNFSSIVVDEANPNYKSVDGILYTKDGKSLICCPRGKEGVIKVADGTEEILPYAFYGCSKAEEVVLPASLRRFAGYSYSPELSGAFSWMLNLSKINLPEGIERIGAKTFRTTLKLNHVKMPNSLKYLGKAFSTIGYMPDAPDSMLVSIDWQDAEVDTIVSQAITKQPHFQVTLPKHLRYLGEGAFEGCPVPTQLIIPENIEYFGQNIFGSNDSIMRLKSIICYRKEPLFMEPLIFSRFVKQGRKYVEEFCQDWADACTLYVPASSVEAYKADENWGRFGKILPIEDELTAIDAAPSPEAKTEDVEAIYTVNGQKLSRLQKGINIIRYKNTSKARKVVVE